MTRFISISFFLLFGTFAFGQANNQTASVEKTCMNYIEGFYEGDQMKLKAALQPTLNKFGYWFNNEKNSYGQPIHMTFEQALNFAKDVKEKKNFPAADAPKKVEVLDVIDKIACAKVTAWWGYDYLLLSKAEEGWKIEQVIWQGPYQSK